MRKKELTASEMGRLGGLATSAKLTPEQKSEKGRKAVMARWAKRKAAEGK